MPVSYRRTLVLGDVHGAHKALLQVLERAQFHPEQDRIISLGDLTDYHPDSAEVITTLMTLPHLVAVRGNHDTWVQEYLETGEMDSVWVHNGGEATIDSIYWRSDRDKELYRRFFMRQRPWFLDEENRLYVHAGIDRLLPLELQEERILYWDRKFWTDACKAVYYNEPIPSNAFKEVFLGHTPTPAHWPDLQPVQRGNIWNVDQGIKRGGRLTLMDVETKEFWQSDTQLELYPLSEV